MVCDELNDEVRVRSAGNVFFGNNVLIGISTVIGIITRVKKSQKYIKWLMLNNARNVIWLYTLMLQWLTI